MEKSKKTGPNDRFLKKKRRNPAALLCNAAGTVILILLILACLPLTLPRLAGYRLYTVISGSMEPEIPVDSLVLVRGADPVQMAEGDVIAFYGAHGSSAVITHRVVSNRPAEGEIVTKGDANPERDMNPVPYEDFIGKVEHVIPGAGALAEKLGGPAGRQAAGGLLILAALLLALGSGLDRRKRKRRIKKRKKVKKEADL
ncbi:signal peptidase I [Lachnoclostridium sp. An131]|uniref:signal peptidase I n=1 Tax=Lachnoclostridium sp. An131 TaxID=1965555 RepID=UPI001FA8CE98|nr:signal peptidase I [Lachnoclostridium sp. An131]